MSSEAATQQPQRTSEPLKTAKLAKRFLGAPGGPRTLDDLRGRHVHGGEEVSRMHHSQVILMRHGAPMLMKKSLSPVTAELHRARSCAEDGARHRNQAVAVTSNAVQF